MIRPSEGGHWYDRHGIPRYEVMAKDGSMRPATLRDARKFGWYPGLTSIIRCAASPGLELWKQRQVMLAALTLPRRDNENDDAFCARVMADSGEQAREARDRGTEIHAAIQGHYEGTPPSEELWPFVQGVVRHIAGNFGEQTWLPEKAVAHPSGFGTKADLHCAGIVLDFKGKDFGPNEAADLETHDEHHMQLAATREALLMPDARCGIVYVSRTHAGTVRICEVDEKDLARGWEMFRSLHAYWKASRNYYPEQWKEAA